MAYDGLLENFPKSGLCPMCNPANAESIAREREDIAQSEQAEREICESEIQAAIDNEIQMLQ